MKDIYRKNEFETNEIVSKAIRVVLIFYLIVGLFCWLDIFSISNRMINVWIGYN